MFESAAIALNLWEVNVEREKKKRKNAGKDLTFSPFWDIIKARKR